MEFRQKYRFSQIVSYQLKYIYKGPKLHKGVSLDHLEPFRIRFKTFEKFRGAFRGRFRIFQIVSFKVKRGSNVPQIDTE